MIKSFEMMDLMEDRLRFDSLVPKRWFKISGQDNE